MISKRELRFSKKRQEKEIETETILQRYFQIIDINLLKKYLAAAHRDLMRICRQIGGFIHSTGEKNCGGKEFYLGMFERLVLSVLIDSDWTDTACFGQSVSHPERISEERTQEIWQEAIIHFEDHMKHLDDNGEKSPLNVYRNEISDICFRAAKEEQNLYRLTVPTGAGKTFSSLRFALHHAQKYHKSTYHLCSALSIQYWSRTQRISDRRWAMREFVLEHHCNIFL